jgi:hypothetical protein
MVPAWSDSARTTRCRLQAGSNFKSALKDLRAATNPNGNLREHYAVGFHEAGKNSTISVYTRDAKLVLGLFDKAVKAGKNNFRGNRFEKMWKDRPPKELNKINETIENAQPVPEPAEIRH